jgi:hypothetical protein
MSETLPHVALLLRIHTWKQKLTLASHSVDASETPDIEFSKEYTHLLWFLRHSSHAGTSFEHLRF